MCNQDLEIIEKIKQIDNVNDITEGIKIMRQKRENYTKSEQEKQIFEMKTSVIWQLLDTPIP